LCVKNRSRLITLKPNEEIEIAELSCVKGYVVEVFTSVNFKNPCNIQCLYEINNEAKILNLSHGLHGLSIEDQSDTNISLPHANNYTLNNNFGQINNLMLGDEVILSTTDSSILSSYNFDPNHHPGDVGIISGIENYNEIFWLVEVFWKRTQQKSLHRYFFNVDNALSHDTSMQSSHNFRLRTDKYMDGVKNIIINGDILISSAARSYSKNNLSYAILNYHYTKELNRKMKWDDKHTNYFEITITCDDFDISFGVTVCNSLTAPVSFLTKEGLLQLCHTYDCKTG
jgi:hypothetical protein